MRIAIFVIAGAILAAAVRWLAHYADRRDSGNSDGTEYLAQDSTRAGYARRFKVIIWARQARLSRHPAEAAETRTAKAETELPIPETRVGE